MWLVCCPRLFAPLWVWSFICRDSRGVRSCCYEAPWWCGGKHCSGRLNEHDRPLRIVTAACILMLLNCTLCNVEGGGPRRDTALSREPNPSVWHLPTEMEWSGTWDPGRSLHLGQWFKKNQFGLQNFKRRPLKTINLIQAYICSRRDHVTSKAWDFSCRNSMQLMDCLGIARKSSFSCHFRQLLQNGRKCSVCSAGRQICLLVFSPHSQTPFLTRRSAGLRLAEPLLCHLNLNAAIQTCQQPQWWGNLTWHFFNPVHWGLPLWLSGTSIAHDIISLETYHVRVLNHGHRTQHTMWLKHQVNALWTG